MPSKHCPGIKDPDSPIFLFLPSPPPSQHALDIRPRCLRQPPHCRPRLASKTQTFNSIPPPWPHPISRRGQHQGSHHKRALAPSPSVGETLWWAHHPSAYTHAKKPTCQLFSLQFRDRPRDTGDVVYLHVFGQGLVFLNSPEAAFNLLDKRGSIYSDRPQQVMTGELWVSLLLPSITYHTWVIDPFSSL